MKRLYPLEPRHIAALESAEKELFHMDFCPYLELKELFRDRSPRAQYRFRRLFTRYYNLNTGGLTEEFHDRFFAILFSDSVMANGVPRYEPILNELCFIKRRKGDCAMPFSFVSKLAATHDEKSPIYDRHVLAFFEWKVPPTSEDKAARIAWFIDFLRYIRASYCAWAVDPLLMPVLDRFRNRDAKLAELHPVRLIDFLIWKVGNGKLLPEM